MSGSPLPGLPASEVGRGGGRARVCAEIPQDVQPSPPAFQKHESAKEAGVARAASAVSPSGWEGSGGVAERWQPGAHGAG